MQCNKVLLKPCSISILLTAMSDKPLYSVSVLFWLIENAKAGDDRVMYGVLEDVIL